MSAPIARPPLTVVHVTAPAPVGGMESVVSALARGHAARGHRPHVISIFNRGESAYALAAGIPGVTTHVIEIPARRYWRERAAVAAIARASGAHVLHTHGYRPDVVDAGAARTLGVAAVTTVHGFTRGGLKSRFFEWLQMRAFRRLDAVVAVSEPLRRQLVLAGVPAEKVHGIPNAWAPAQEPLDRAAARRRLALPVEGPLVAWVGRLTREKAPDVFLEALGRLGAGAPAAAFIGDGPDGPRLRRRAAELGLEGRVHWCGRVDAAAALFSGFDVFVLSSRTEGTPITLLEAMAACTPVIATRVGGVPDVVSTAEALLVEPEDPDALARAIHHALVDSGGSAARAAAARARLDREFAVEPWLLRYEELYRGVLRARQRA